MGFPEDLLEQAAILLDGRHGDPPNQASLRRSVSTAYYALFHLLIDEAVSIWPLDRHRNVLARTFEHRSMKKVCETLVDDFDKKGRPANGLKLRDVAQTFTELQEKRHTADYDNSQIWTRVSAEALVARANEAVDTCGAIRNEEKAQDFLYALLFPKPTRS